MHIASNRIVAPVDGDGDVEMGNTNVDGIEICFGMVLSRLNLISSHTF